MLTRREFGRLTLAGLALPRFAAAAIDSRVAGVHLGAQTYSFRDLKRTPGANDAVDVVVDAMTQCGLGECELFASHIEPVFPGGQRGSPEAQKAREDLRRWRLETPIDHFRGVGRKFSDAGITVHAFNYSFNQGMTDGEIDRGFEMANALGAPII